MSNPVTEECDKLMAHFASRDPERIQDDIVNYLSKLRAYSESLPDVGKDDPVVVSTHYPAGVFILGVVAMMGESNE